MDSDGFILEGLSSNFFTFQAGSPGLYSLSLPQPLSSCKCSFARSCCLLPPLMTCSLLPFVTGRSHLHRP